MTWDSEYYTTQDTDPETRAEISQQRRHLDRFVAFSSSDDYSSGHDNRLRKLKLPRNSTSYWLSLIT